MPNNCTHISYDHFLNSFKEIIRKNNLKLTPQREAILQTLHGNPEHFTSENLYLLLKKKCPELNIGIATVYRTLALLEENGLVSSISLGTQGKKFEVANKPHHDHIICEICGKIVEFENEKIELLQEQVATDNGFIPTSHLLQLYGVCSECQ